MTDQDMAAQIERELTAQVEAEVKAEMGRKRSAIADRLRREASEREYARKNARHPIQGPGDPVAEAKRRAIMDARAAADFERIRQLNSRPVEGGLVRDRRASIGPDAEGFTIKGSAR